MSAGSAGGDTACAESLVDGVAGVVDESNPQPFLSDPRRQHRHPDSPVSISASQTIPIWASRSSRLPRPAPLIVKIAPDLVAVCFAADALAGNCQDLWIQVSS